MTTLLGDTQFGFFKTLTRTSNDTKTERILRYSLSWKNYNKVICERKLVSQASTPIWNETKQRYIIQANCTKLAAWSISRCLHNRRFYSLFLF